MAKSIKIFCAVVCSFAALFISIGYATVTGTLTITGTATYSLPDVYISSVEALDANGTDIAHSETMFSATSNFTNGSSVIYRITVVNTTGVDYGYLMTTAISDATLGAGNALVKYEAFTDVACTQEMKRGTVLPPSDSNGDNVIDRNLTFYLKITPKANTTTTAKTSLNCKFITPISDIPSADADIGALAANQAADSFARILNDSVQLAALKGQMENEQAAEDNNRENALFKFLASLLRWDVSSTDTIAYVPDTIARNGELDPSDAEICLALFGGENLQLNIDGVNQNVYFMIYKTNVDGIGDEEYVLYMTTDPLTRTTTTNWLGTRYDKQESATVYAAVFTPYQISNNEIKYYQLGDMYTGTSTICDYSGGDGFTLGGFTGVVKGSGSFNPADWKTSEAYYELNSKATLTDLMQAKATASSECMAALKSQLDKAEAILNYEKVVGGVTFTAEDLYTEESLNHLKTVYGWDGGTNSITGLSDVYTEIMNGNSTTYSQAMVVTATRWMNEALVNLDSK